eukprot:jgi/Mesvir1/3957/Mv09991-RA.1
MGKPEPILEFSPAPSPEKLGGGIRTLIKTRLAVVLATTVLIAVSCFVTWRISTKTSVDAVDTISLAFRNSATSHEIDAVKCFLATLETAASVLLTHSTALLRNASEVTEEMLSVGTGGIRRITWTTFSSHPRMTMALFLGRKHRRLVGFDKAPSEQTAQMVGSPVYELRYVNETRPMATMVGVDLVDGMPLPGAPTMILCQTNTTYPEEPTLPDCQGGAQGPGAAVYLPVNPRVSREMLARLDAASVSNLSYDLIIGYASEPVLAVLASVPGASPEPVGTILTTSSATLIHTVLQRLDLVARLHGRAYVAVLEPSRRLNLVSASHGPIVGTVVGGDGEENVTTLLSAFDTPEQVIRASALYLNSTQDMSMPSVDIDVETYLPSLGRFYLSARSLTFRNMHLAVVLLVPYAAIRGEVDQAQDLSFVVVVVVAAAFCLAGALLSILFTIHVGRQVKAKVVLEGSLEEAMSANARLESRLRTLEHSKLAMRARGDVNMETAAEQGVRLLEGVFAGKVKPTAEVLAEIKSLLTAQDRNLPLFLRGNTDMRKHPRPSSAGHIDKETSAWLTMTVGSTGGATQNHTGAKPERSYRRLSWNTTCDVTTCSDDLEVEKVLREVQMITRILPRVGGPHGLLKRVIPLRVAADGSKPGGASCVGIGVPRPSRSTVRRWSHGCDDDSNELLPMNLYLASGSQHSGPGSPNQRNGDYGRGDGGVDHEAARIAAMEVRGVQVGKLQELILRVGDFNLDVRMLDAVSKHRPVLFVGYSVMLASGLLEMFQLPERPLVAFLCALDKGMPDNPYHSRIHLADVTNNLFHIITCSGVKPYLQNIDILACVTAALMHDFKHPGRNNDFLIKTRHELAIRYNDRHALESYHLAEAFTLLLDSDVNFLKGLDAISFVTLRDLAIDMVLSTDLKCHFDILNEFKARLKQSTPWDRENMRDRRLLLQMMLKLADIGHAAKPLSQHIEWSRAMSEEFWLQGDDEKMMGLTVSPFMDRATYNEAKSQSGFFSFIVQPLFEAWVAGFPDSRHLADQVALNLEHWVSVMEVESPGPP